MYSIMRKIAVLQTGKKPSNETDFEEKPSNETDCEVKPSNENRH